MSRGSVQCQKIMGKERNEDMKQRIWHWTQTGDVVVHCQVTRLPHILMFILMHMYISFYGGLYMKTLTFISFFSFFSFAKQFLHLGVILDCVTGVTTCRKSSYSLGNTRVDSLKCFSGLLIYQVTGRPSLALDTHIKQIILKHGISQKGIILTLLTFQVAY